MIKKVETYVLDGNNASNIPLPHDCKIKDIREDDDYLIIDFEDNISYHDAIMAFHPNAQALTVRFHLEYGGLDGVKSYGGLQGIYQYESGFADTIKKRYESIGHVLSISETEELFHEFESMALGMPLIQRGRT